jgi:hypothetical protein
MHRLAFILALLAGLALAQTRTDDFDAPAVVVTAVQLWPLMDGGCQARACGEVRSLDGGAVDRECTDAFDIRAAGNVNRCLGLRDSFAPRLQKALRFDVDAGAP